MRTTLAVCLGLFAVLSALPAKTAAIDPPTDKEWDASAHNLKAISLAIQSYADSNGDILPGNITNKDGKPLLSWRVRILQHLDQDALYNEFLLDEPWDSAHNKKLIEKMPKIYAPVRVKAKVGETFYQTFTGPGTMFDPQPKYKIGNIPDGTSNTGAVYEAGEPVIWTKPADLVYDAKKPLPKLGGLFDGECHVALFDGSVLHMKKDPDQKVLRDLIRPDEGNVLDLDKLQK